MDVLLIITQITGAMNAQKELTRSLASRLNQLENQAVLPKAETNTLTNPKTEQDLKDIRK